MEKLSSSTLLVVSLILLTFCTETAIPTEIYGYQVSRLFSGDTTKVWSVSKLVLENNQVSSDCSSQVKFLSENDSLRVIWTTNGCQTLGDTVFNELGIITSRDGLAFTDSILYETGEFWKVKDVTAASARLEFEYSGEEVKMELIYP